MHNFHFKDLEMFYTLIFTSFKLYHLSTSNFILPSTFSLNLHSTFLGASGVIPLKVEKNKRLSM